MPRVPVGFVGPTAISRSTNINDQYALNLYPVVEGEGARASMTLHPVPGLLPLLTAGSGPCRSQGITFKNKLYFVSGNNLFSIDNNMVVLIVGVLSSSFGRCGIVAGRNYLLVVDGLKGYSWDGTIYAVLNLDIAGITAPQYCTWQDGYFIVNQGNSDSWYISNPDNPTTALFTGSITTTTLTVTNLVSGELSIGQTLDGAGISANTTITALGTGVGGAGTYTVNNTQNVGSESMTATAWGALEFAVAQAKPDVAYRPENASGIVYLFGEFSTQAYEETGAALFPFDPIIPQGVFDYGTAAPDSVAKMDATIFWLAKSERGTPIVTMCQGLNLKKVSPPDLDVLIGGYPSVYDAQGFCYRHLGHTFYVLTFPSVPITWVYDLEMDKWHNRRTYQKGLWRVAGLGIIGNKIVCGDYATNQFYQLSPTTFTDGGLLIERIRRGPIISQQNRILTFVRLEIVFQGGVGLATGQGSDPQAMLQWSDDGGHTWSNELWASIGQIGQYKNRAIWNSLGVSPGREFQVTVTDPVYCTIIDAYCDIEVDDE